MNGLDGERFDVVSPRGKARVGYWEIDGAQHGPYRPSEIVCRGTYEDVLDFFDARMWTDGLPIVPPTIDRIERTLSQVDRRPDEILAVVGDEEIEATVWNAAVNAVMAGCRDQDFPIALELAGIMADPAFRIRDAGSTTSWEVLVLLSGPDLPDRGFNTETGVMRMGRRANTALGRFTRLWIRNIAGLLIPPGFTDMAAIGQSFHVAMAENDEGCHAVGWPTCRQEWGFRADDIVVAAQGIVGASGPIYTSGGSPESHLRVLGAAIAGCSAHIAGIGASNGQWAPVLAMTPAIAEVFARAGMTKDDVRHALGEHALAPARLLVDGAEALGRRRPDFGQLVADGLLSRAFHESDDPDRLVSTIPFPEQLAIVVTGNPGRNQSRFYIPLGQPGQRTAKRVG